MRPSRFLIDVIVFVFAVLIVFSLSRKALSHTIYCVSFFERVDI